MGFLADGLPPDWANPDYLKEKSAALSMQITAALEEAGIPPEQFHVNNIAVLVDEAGEPYKVLVGGTVAFFSDEGSSMQDFASQLKDLGTDIFANISSALPGTEDDVSLTYDNVSSLPPPPPPPSFLFPRARKCSEREREREREKERRQWKCVGTWIGSTGECFW